MISLAICDYSGVYFRFGASGAGFRGVAGGLGARDDPAEDYAADYLRIKSSLMSNVYASFVSCSLMDLVRNFSALAKSRSLMALFAMCRHFSASSAFILFSLEEFPFAE